MTLQRDSEGYVTGIGELTQDQYLAGVDVCAHPALNASTAKIVSREVPEDAWRQHRASGERVERVRSAAMDGGNLLDSLLTGPEYSTQFAGTRGQEHYTYKSGKQKGQTSVCAWQDWNGLRILDADDFKGEAAKLARDGAGRNTVVKRADFEAEIRVASDVRARLELVRVDIRDHKRQVPIYWVEHASDGTPVQCRGMLDLMRPSRDDENEVWHVDIRDLKRVESLRGESLSRGMDTYGWHIQAAAYKRAVHAHYGVSTHFEWLFVRTSPTVAVRRAGLGETLREVGEFYWQYAVDEWAKGLRTKMWRGWEQDQAPLEATPWQLAAVEAKRIEIEDAESEAAQ